VVLVVEVVPLAAPLALLFALGGLSRSAPPSAMSSAWTDGFVCSCWLLGALEAIMLSGGVAWMGRHSFVWPSAAAAILCAGSFVLGRLNELESKWATVWSSSMDGCMALDGTLVGSMFGRANVSV
jgi:hypothetical protein